jgi:hypothetical protein
MNEASLWRYALAQQIAPYYCANPKVTAVSVGGSVSQGCADLYSDIDLAVFWTDPPTEKERRSGACLAGPTIRRSRLLWLLACAFRTERVRGSIEQSLDRA